MEWEVAHPGKGGPEEHDVIGQSRDCTIRYISFPIGSLLTLTQIRSIRTPEL